MLLLPQHRKAPPPPTMMMMMIWRTGYFEEEEEATPNGKRNHSILFCLVEMLICTTDQQASKQTHARTQVPTKSDLTRLTARRSLRRAERVVELSAVNHPIQSIKPYQIKLPHSSDTRLSVMVSTSLSQ
mmetsp:Transcript_10636/g.22563  ORF Transcript_10636/g.22563 Transcript_10636/m.22563 type:complete len:129 (+) Transcript_10636:383-769(+)